MAAETTSNPVDNAPSAPAVDRLNASRAQEVASHGNWMCQMRQYDDAVKYFTEAIKLDPTEVRFYGNRAACYEVLGNYSAALEDSNLALRISPNWIKGYYRRATALEGLGRYEEAEHCLNQLLSLAPTCAEAACARVRVMTARLAALGVPSGRARAAVLYYGSVQRAASECLASSAGALSDVFDSDDDEALSCGAHFLRPPPPPHNNNVDRPQDLNGEEVVTGKEPQQLQQQQQQGFCVKARAPSTNTTLSSSNASAGAVTPPAFSQVAAQACQNEQRAKATPPPPSTVASGGERVQSTARGSQSPPVGDPLLDPRNPLKWDTLWVGNLKPNTSEKLVVDIFSRYGKIKNTRMILDKHCVFITYHDWRAAGDAIRHQQGAEINKQKVLIKFPDRALENSQHKSAGPQNHHHQNHHQNHHHQSRVHQPVVLRKKTK